MLSKLTQWNNLVVMKRGKYNFKIRCQACWIKSLLKKIKKKRHHKNHLEITVNARFQNSPQNSPRNVSCNFDLIFVFCTFHFWWFHVRQQIGKNLNLVISLKLIKLERKHVNWRDFQKNLEKTLKTTYLSTFKLLWLVNRFTQFLTLQSLNGKKATSSRR